MLFMLRGLHGFDSKAFRLRISRHAGGSSSSAALHFACRAALRHGASGMRFANSCQAMAQLHRTMSCVSKTT